MQSSLEMLLVVDVRVGVTDGVGVSDVVADGVSDEVEVVFGVGVTNGIGFPDAIAVVDVGVTGVVPVSSEVGARGSMLASLRVIVLTTGRTVGSLTFTVAIRARIASLVF